MTPERWNDERLDDLAYQVRVVLALTNDVVSNTAEIKGHDDDIEALREAQREILRRAEKMLEKVGEECVKNTDRVELKVDALTKAQRWTPTQWAAILGPTLTALIGAAALVATKGSP